MSQADTTHDRTRTVTCPECGEAFDPRGLPAHLRWKHPQEHELPGALPSRAGGPTAASRLDRTFAMLAQSLAAIDRRLTRIERKLGDLTTPSTGDAIEDARARLGQELGHVLERIDALKKAEREGRPEPSSGQMLGHLRRRQAHLLYQIAELSPEGRERAKESGIGTTF